MPNYVKPDFVCKSPRSAVAENSTPLIRLQVHIFSASLLKACSTNRDGGGGGGGGGWGKEKKKRDREIK